MKIDLALIASRLSSVRSLLDVSVDHVSQKTGIAIERLTLIESEKLEPSGDELLILAKYYSTDFRVFIDPKLPEPFKQAGELSCLAIAYRIRTVSMLTDEKLARNYARDFLKLEVGTTPRLYGYLHFHYHLSESDHGSVIEEHERFERRPLTKFLNEAFETALRCKLMASQNPSR